MSETPATAEPDGAAQGAGRAAVELGATEVAGPAVLGTAELATWASRLAVLAGAGDDAERVDQLRLLEEIKGACAAAQARVSVAFADSQLAAQDAAGVRARERARGSARRSRWRAGSPRTAVPACWAWPAPSLRRCRTPCTR